MCRKIIIVSGHAVRITIIVVAVASFATAAQPTSASEPTCQVAGALVRLPELPEGSGVAASLKSPGRLWTHNDSGQPVLIALDAQGAVAGRVSVTGAKVGDWEALAVGPCPAGTCIYIGDIGDNDAERRTITIYRVAEPTSTSGSVAVADEFRASYPDGAHNAETLFVTPQGEMIIVTKGDTGPVALYRLPADTTPGGVVTLQPVGKPRPSRPASADERITDGAMSPSGAWVVLRTKTEAAFHRTEDLMSGTWKETSSVSLKGLGEPQGEGIAFGDERTLFLVGEGGGKSRPGTFGRLTCASD
jgi:hypothetical protein